MLTRYCVWLSLKKKGNITQNGFILVKEETQYYEKKGVKYKIYSYIRYMSDIAISKFYILLSPRFNTLINLLNRIYVRKNLI